MSLFQVYPLFPVELVRGKGAYVYDSNGQKYLDLYGGHAVISVGHSHPKFAAALKQQIDELIFYSNSVENPVQAKLAEQLALQSGYTNYHLFMISSGAEANENALKLASFHTVKSRIICFEGGFHGRTTGVVAATDNPKILPEYGQQLPITRLPLDNIEAVSTELSRGDVAAVIIEGIQGVAGIVEPGLDFLKRVRALCTQHEVPLILDEVQSGFGRTGKFFAHQHAEIEADIVTMAKGMGNGFPVGGILIAPHFEAKFGMLGTTFGGNPLAARATLAVLDILQEEGLIQHAAQLGDYIIERASQLLPREQITGRGLMIGLNIGKAIKPLRQKLIFDHHMFTGSSKNPDVIRLLPPLNITKEEIDLFFTAFEKELNT